jgi:hypothetical protein
MFFELPFENAAIAFSELLWAETTIPSGFFLKKKPPSRIQKDHVNSENALMRSR